MRRDEELEGLLGPLEQDVMEAVWDLGDSTVRDVHAVLAEEREIAYTTVMTVMARLHDKDILSREKQGRGYQYRPRYTEEQLVEELGREEVEQLLERFGGVALAHFATALGDADPEQLRRLTELASEQHDA